MEQENPQSLLQIIHNAIGGSSTLPRGFSLPSVSDAEIQFADGALDGIALYHMGVPEITDEIREGIKSAVTAASDEDFDRAGELFKALSEKIPVIHAIDELQSFIIENRDSLNAKNLYNCSAYFLTESADRACVKFGMSILELFNTENNSGMVSVVTNLAMCDEFTLFALFIMSKWKDANKWTFEMAKRTHGWGRIHAVERLEPETDEIKKWLLREGINNDVLSAYSALTCWEKSGAAELLHNTNLSDEDFTAIANLIDALLDEGPCAGISAVENNTQILAEFLNIAQSRTLSIDDYVIIRSIRISFEEENPEIAAKCSEILNTENCRECVKNAEKSVTVIPLAKELGIDFRQDAMKILESNFAEKFYICKHLMSDGYREKTIEIFRKNLPLEELKTTPADDFPIGEKFQIHNRLDCIIQELEHYPLEGVDLVETALQCAPAGTRNCALRVLQSWVNIGKKPLETLLPEIYKLIQTLVNNEPNNAARERMENLLSGEIGENSEE